MDTTYIAEFRCVTKLYGAGLPGRSAVCAVRDVNLAVPAGEAFGLLGPNRAARARWSNCC